MSRTDELYKTLALVRELEIIIDAMIQRHNFTNDDLLIVRARLSIALSHVDRLLAPLTPEEAAYLGNPDNDNSR